MLYIVPLTQGITTMSHHGIMQEYYARIIMQSIAQEYYASIMHVRIMPVYK